jgi:hypothetical protein
MGWGHFTRVTSVTGIAVFGLGTGLALTACSPTTSEPGASTTITNAAASAPASGTPASTASASASNTVAPSGAPASVPLSAPATPTPTPTGTVANAVPVKIAANGPYFVVWSCDDKPLVEPTGYVLSCGDGGNGIKSAHWTSWTPNGATGVGTEYLNACIPNCAEGTIIDYPVDISLTGSYLAAQDLPFAYAKITFTYLAARPPIYVTVNGKVELTHPATWSPPLPERPASHSAGS